MAQVEDRERLGIMTTTLHIEDTTRHVMASCTAQDYLANDTIVNGTTTTILMLTDCHIVRDHYEEYHVFAILMCSLMIALVGVLGWFILVQYGYWYCMGMKLVRWDAVYVHPPPAEETDEEEDNDSDMEQMQMQQPQPVVIHDA